MKESNRCKKCCCQSPTAILSVLVVCSLISTILAGVILQDGFTTAPTKHELFVGSLVTGIVVVSSIALVVGTMFLLLSCWRDHRKRRQNNGLFNKNIVKPLGSTDSNNEEGGQQRSSDFDDIIVGEDNW